jgi:hypothetical protein
MFGRPFAHSSFTFRRPPDDEHEANSNNSELHVFRGHQPSPTGFIMGHEFTGVVSEIGDDIKTVKVGDKVVVPFTVSWYVVSASTPFALPMVIHCHMTYMKTNSIPRSQQLWIIRA